MRLAVFALLTLMAMPCRATDVDAVALSKRWIEAIRKNDAEQLTKLTHLPFTEHGLRDKPCSAKERVQTPAEFKTLLGCFAKRGLLTESIPEDVKYLDDFKVTEASAIVPKAFRKKLAPLAKDHTFVTGSLAGDGITFLLVFEVRPDGTIDGVLADGQAYE